MRHIYRTAASTLLGIAIPLLSLDPISAQTRIDQAQPATLQGSISAKTSAPASSGVVDQSTLSVLANIVDSSSPFSAAGRYFARIAGEQAEVVDVNTGETVFRDLPLGNGTIRWDPLDSDSYLYFAQSRLVRHRLTKGTDEVLLDLEGRFRIIKGARNSKLLSDHWIAFVAPLERNICGLDFVSGDAYCAELGESDFVNLGVIIDGSMVKLPESNKQYLFLKTSKTPVVFEVAPGDKTLQVVLRDSESVSASAEVIPNAIDTLSLCPTTSLSNPTSFIGLLAPGIVTTVSPAPTGGFACSVTSSTPQVAAVSSSTFTVPAGSTQGLFFLYPDNPGTTNVAVTCGANTVNAQLTILPYGTPIISFSSPKASSDIPYNLAVVAEVGNGAYVHGVQFTLDGQAIGSELKPLTGQWAETYETRLSGLAPGTHKIGANLRNNVGEITVASPVSFTVSSTFISSLPRIGTYRPTAWRLDLTGDGVFGLGDASFVLGSPLGAANDIPIVGDWTRSGFQRVGMFRDGVWFFDTNGNHVWEFGTDKYAFYGIQGDKPIVGDWNGDGRTKIGVYRAGWWYLDWDGDNAWTTGVDKAFFWGSASDIPVTGDWTGSGTTKIGLYSNGTWRLDLNGDFKFDTTNDTQILFGVAGDIPIPADVYRRGKAEPVVFRPSSGAWVTPYGTLGYFGVLGDVPIVGRW